MAKLRDLRDERGQALPEYGLLLALLALVCVVALIATGTSIQDILDRVAGML